MEAEAQIGLEVPCWVQPLGAVVTPCVLRAETQAQVWLQQGWRIWPVSRRVGVDVPMARCLRPRAGGALVEKWKQGQE